MEHVTPSRVVGLGDFVVLPDYLIAYITCRLELRDVLHLACASRLMRLFCAEEPLWLALCLRETHGLLEYQANWRQTALQMYTERTVPEESSKLAVVATKAPADFSSMFLYKRWYRCNMHLGEFTPALDSIERVNAEAMSSHSFLTQYDLPSRPVMLQGLLKDWPVEDWMLPAIAARYGDVAFKVSKPMGGACQMMFRHYVDYIERQHDEEPLYVFDDRFGESAPGMLDSYHVPRIFAQDYLSTLGSKRPPHRWLVLGPGRSGAGWHVDPSLTSAWNSLLSGRKRWGLYPPGRTPPGIPEPESEDSPEHEEELSALQWFLEVYPTLAPEDRPLEFVQHAGETVFVPGGWWHVVLNLEPTVAITQNFVSEGNLQRVVEYMAMGADQYNAKQAELLEAAEEEEEEAGTCWWAPLTRPGTDLPTYLRPQLQHLPTDYPPVEALLGVRFQRNRMLGRWLRQLCLAEPQLEERIVHIARQVLGLDVWARVLGDICTQLGLPAPSQHELFPHSGATSNVFMVGDIAIKVFCHESKAIAQLLCDQEAFLVRLMAATSDALARAVPQLIAIGAIVHGPAAVHMPFIVMSRATGGVSLGEVITELPRESIRSSAEQLGYMLADLHATASALQPLVLAQAHGVPVLRLDVSDLEGKSPGWVDQQEEVAVVKAETRLDGQGMLLPDVVGEMQQGAFFHDRDGNLWTSAHGLLIKSLELEDGAAPEDAGGADDGKAPPVEVPQEWLPFVQYLRNRCKLATMELTDAGPLPRWLLDSMAAYLPADPAALLGLLSPTPVAGPTSTPPPHTPKMPCLLHGDLSAGNVLVLLGSDGAEGPAGSTGLEGQVRGTGLPGGGDRQGEEQGTGYHANGGTHGKAHSNGAVHFQAKGIDLSRSDNGHAANGHIKAPASDTADAGGGGQPADPPDQASKPAAQHVDGTGTAMSSPTDHGSAAGPAAGSSRVRLLDFADAGHGDPLFDMIALWHSCFRSHDRVMSVFLDSYNSRLAVHSRAAAVAGASADQGANPSGCEGTAAPAAGVQREGLAAFWPQRGGLSLSYCAMCYTLLHEEHPLVNLFKLRSELWETSSLEQLQGVLWGFLDSPSWE